MVRGQPQQSKSESSKSAGGPFQGVRFHLQGQVKGGMCSSPSIAPKKPAKSTTHGSHTLIKAMSLHRGLNPGPSVYKTDARKQVISNRLTKLDERQMLFAQSDGCAVRPPLTEWRLEPRPLGQTVLINNGWEKACKAHHEASV